LLGFSPGTIDTASSPPLLFDVEALQMSLLPQISRDEVYEEEDDDEEEEVGEERATAREYTAKQTTSKARTQEKYIIM
jgi:hypothetical protein